MSVKWLFPGRNVVLLIFWLFVWPVAFQCRPASTPEQLDQFLSRQLVEWNRSLTLVVITDVLTPPVCSRVYAYSNVAAYEVLRQLSPKVYPSFAGKLNGLQEIPSADSAPNACDYRIAAIIAFSTVAQQLVFNRGAVQDLENEFLEKLEQLPVDSRQLSASVDYGRKAGELLFKWAAADGYLQRNARPAYIVTKQAGRWIPTPPDYMDAVEPNWKTLRPYFLDSAAQFRPVSPLAFDSSRSSPYFQQVKQVYEAVKDSAPESALIARFWDCNPNISVTQGHVTYFQQKISPGGHWVHIAASVCEKEKYDLVKTAQLLSTTAVAIAEGFISCWEAKYHYTTIRPETVINKYWDKDWRPLLQTPPFPEYPSGHSVVSGAASTVLSALVSPDYSFTDSTEVAFGMPVRTFSSFLQAGQEASRSRLYGGIHYPQALDNGFAQGQDLAHYLLRKLSK